MRTWAVVAAVIAPVALTGCGDVESTDPRPGYSKAPLEDPGLFIRSEERTAMDLLGEPDRLVVRPDAAATDTGETGQD